MWKGGMLLVVAALLACCRREEVGTIVGPGLTVEAPDAAPGAEAGLAQGDAGLQERE